MKVLIIDNYDSFTYNLVHYIEGFDVEVDTCYNSDIPFKTLLQYDKIVLSPGPGLPHEAGELMTCIRQYHDKIPLLGVCLGFQALVCFFGGEIYNQNHVKHGVKMQCHFNTESKLFLETNATFNVGLYHSWAAKADGFPANLNITAQSKDQVIMAFEHSHLPLYGVQFHPESILSEYGHKIIENFLRS